MHLADLAHALPLALDGESEAGNNTAIGIISVVSIASGWILLFCLWYFVFREKARAKRRKGSSPE